MIAIGPTSLGDRVCPRSLSFEVASVGDRERLHREIADDCIRQRLPGRSRASMAREISVDL
ncbi:hypothetical protein TIFTF001_031706 [Ficus carica]|uniref:Uncharacterized protein n=1 Tax=Ficus carica TaxID=3494 RepID=A0AA88DX22_FICCA|nr:hypothetical protein TIFTF001_031706 [Ficus carica]